MVTMDNSISCVWWALRGTFPISCLTAILDLVVAPSNKEFYFLFALGTICEFLSIFNMAVMLAPFVAPSNKNSVSCMVWGLSVRSSHFYLLYWFELLPMATSNLLYIIYVISLVTCFSVSIVCDVRSHITSNIVANTINYIFGMGLWWWDSLFLISISELFVTNFLKYLVWCQVGLVASTWLHCLFHLVPFDIYWKYYWIIFRWSVFGFYCLWYIIFQFYCLYLWHCHRIYFDCWW